jgi:two-component system sensor histidine kinase UhpB
VERELREAETRLARRQSEQALRDSEERFRQLAENIDLAFVMTEHAACKPMGRVLYVSPAYEKIFGRTCESLYVQPLSWIETICKEDRPRIEAALPTMAEAEFNEQFRIIGPDKSLQWIHYRAFPVRNDEGQVCRLAGIFEDITERRRAQEQLETNARELQKTVEELRLAEDELRASNEQLCRAREELEHRVEERTADLKSANAELQRQMIERRRLENELLEIAEKERKRIGIDLHDELGQHLNGIALMLKGLELKLANKSLNESADAAKIQGLVFTTINQAKAVARDLAQADLKTDNLQSTLQDLASQTENLFSVSCRLTISGDIPSFPENTVKQIYKIAQEAITNADKHAKAQEVELTLNRQNDHLVLTIVNDGVPFPTTRFQSTGMGLRIMQYRANVIGGSFSVGPRTGQKNGAVVTCTFPETSEAAMRKRVNGEESEEERQIGAV